MCVSVPTNRLSTQNSGNLTLINAYLYVFGPTHEGALTTRLLIFQVICSCVALAIRYNGAYLLYDEAL